MHVIIERMDYVFHGHVHFGGVRVSCDQGKSWVVAGTVDLSPKDTFEWRNRAISFEEWRFREGRSPGRTIEIVVPEPAQWWCGGRF